MSNHGERHERQFSLSGPRSVHFRSQRLRPEADGRVLPWYPGGHSRGSNYGMKPAFNPTASEAGPARPTMTRCRALCHHRRSDSPCSHNGARGAGARRELPYHSPPPPGPGERRGVPSIPRRQPCPARLSGTGGNPLAARNAPTRSAGPMTSCRWSATASASTKVSGESRRRRGYPGMRLTIEGAGVSWERFGYRN
jgi:hypothetical protein